MFQIIYILNDRIDTKKCATFEVAKMVAEYLKHKGAIILKISDQNGTPVTNF